MVRESTVTFFRAAMAELQRNFRSAYLEKVRIKGVEEKKSLDVILKEKPVDTSKLEQFCLRFSLTASYRCYVWKLILGIVPTYPEIYDFVLQQRRQQYYDLRETLVTMQRINQSTDVSHIHLRMFLMEKGQLPLSEAKLLDKINNKAFLALTEGIAQTEDDIVDCYWLTSKIFQIQEQHNDIIPYMLEQMESCLKKEDPKLHGHLQNVCGLEAVPASFWFKSCFGSALPDSAFERVCDKVVGGLFRFLIFVAVSALVALKRPLMNKTKKDDIIKYLQKFPEESGDIIVATAMELCQKYGSTMNQATGRSDSPTGQLERGHS